MCNRRYRILVWRGLAAASEYPWRSKFSGLDRPVRYFHKLLPDMLEHYKEAQRVAQERPPALSDSIDRDLDEDDGEGLAPGKTPGKVFAEDEEEF